MIAMTEDRMALLRAVLASDQDNTVRLAYADWLQENGSGDADRATEEFIRVSCSKSYPHRMPLPAYPWLRNNWKRLVPEAELKYSLVERTKAALIRVDELDEPDLIAEDWGWHAKNTPMWMGRVLYVVYSPPPKERKYAARLEFWKGFVVRVGVYSKAGGGLIALVCKDQPLANLHSRQNSFRNTLLQKATGV